MNEPPMVAVAMPTEHELNTQRYCLSVKRQIIWHEIRIKWCRLSGLIDWGCRRRHLPQVCDGCNTILIRNMPDRNCSSRAKWLHCWYVGLRWWAGRNPFRSGIGFVVGGGCNLQLHWGLCIWSPWEREHPRYPLESKFLNSLICWDIFKLLSFLCLQWKLAGKTSEAGGIIYLWCNETITY